MRGSPGGAGLVLAAMTLANAMILVDQTAVPLTLPDILEDFHIGTASAQWVLSGSLLALTSLLVLGGRLADAFGRKRIFLIGITVFTAASAVAGLAPDYPILLAARVVQGAGGALVLPATVAIVSAAYPPSARGRALGTMGGVAAIAGALGPTIGGVLTSAVSWRAVLLVNVPLAIVCVVMARRGVSGEDAGAAASMDVLGAVLLAAVLSSLVIGLSGTQGAPWASAEVLLPLALCVVAAGALVLRERRTADPLLDFALLRGNRNYTGATISQGLAGVIEMGTGVIFPLMLILNMGMDPSVAGFALIPLTLPMVFGAPLAGRWYDRAGGRSPLVAGFALLALSGVVLAIGAEVDEYAAILPGLLVMGCGLALVLTVNDPVTIDMLPEATHAQASGVSATAEQGGGAIGIAVLYAIFHGAYLNGLHERIDDSPLADPTSAQYERLKAEIIAAEQTGLHPSHFDPQLKEYLRPARDAAAHGYSVTFIAVAVIGAIGALAVGLLVRRAPAPAD
ncbi:MAG: MFS transporter [Thermoleophilia bacterium]